VLFLVISNPAPSRPSDMRRHRQNYWEWIESVQSKGMLRDAYSRAGRGAVALFDVDGNETLHALLNEWTEIVPAEFQIVPLIDPEAARTYLRPQ
jgi:muconolactone delta-isomerase